MTNRTITTSEVNPDQYCGEHGCPRATCDESHPATDTAAIESLRTFAIQRSEYPFTVAEVEIADKLAAFIHLCTAALNGEEWAVERVTMALDAIACGEATAASWRTPELDDQHRLDVIRATDTTRPDGAIARSFTP